MAHSLPWLNVPGIGGGVAFAPFESLSAWWTFSESSGQRWNSYQDTLHALDTGTAGTANGHANFVAADSDYLVVPDSAALGLGTDTPFTWTIKFKPASVTGTHMLFAKLNAGATNNLYEYGLYTSGTELSFRLGNGSAFETVTTSGAGLQIGVSYQVTIGHDANNNVISIKINDGALTTKAWTGGTYNGSDDLAFGRAGEFAGLYYDGELWDAGFWNGRYLTAFEQSELYGQSYPFGNVSYQIATLDPDSVSNQYSNHDFSDVSTMYQDTAKTTPVASDADPVRVIESSWGTHDWIAPSDAVRPAWKDNILNSLGVGRWTGTDPEDVADSELDLDATTPAVGDFTWFIIAKNTDAAAGSHIGENTRYIAITGSAYDATSPRLAVHVSDNTALVSSFQTVTASDDFVIIELVRSGTVYTLATFGQSAATLDNASGFNIDQIGPRYTGVAFDNWHFAGDYAQSVIFSAALDAKTRAQVRYFLATKWGLSGVKYAPYVAI